MIDDPLERALARLPQPEPPASFGAEVMSLITAEAAAPGAQRAAFAAPTAATSAPRGVSAGLYAIGLAGTGLAAGATAQRGFAEASALLFSRLDPAIHRLPPPDRISLIAALGLILILTATLTPSQASRVEPGETPT